MRQLKRSMALILSILMLFPTQSISVWAGANTALSGVEVIEEEDRETEQQPAAETEEDHEPGTEAAESGAGEGADRISETLPIEPLEGEPLYIYWNPGTALPAELASASDAKSGSNPGDLATASNSTKTAAKVTTGRDSADGLTAGAPVKTLATAVEKAQLYQASGGIAGDITIYVMNPLEIKDGELYILNAGGLKLKAWPGRSYKSDTLFYLNGGQLTLMNAVLESGQNTDEGELIYIRGGSLQIGDQVTTSDRIVMDYRSRTEEPEWEMDTATSSDAKRQKTASGSERWSVAATVAETVAEAAAEAVAETMAAVAETTANVTTADITTAEVTTEDTTKADTTTTDTTTESAERIQETLPIEPLKEESDKTKIFDIDSYVISTDEDSIELITDKTAKSTWQNPVVELIEGFDNSIESYQLEIRSDADETEFDLVRTLYADDMEAEDFLSCFTLVDAEEMSWNLEAVSESAAEIRDTGRSDIAAFAAVMTAVADEVIADEIRSDDTDSNSGSGLLTKKILRATRSEDAKTIYWNPGGNLTIGSVTYRAGRDTLYDGRRPEYPIKTWEEAVYQSNGGTVVLMRDLDLSKPDTEDYLLKENDAFFLSSNNVRNPENGQLTGVAVKLQIWEQNPSSSIIVNAGDSLILEDVILDGMVVDGVPQSARIITCLRGDVLIRSNVTAESGYIQIEAFPELEQHPIRVSSADPALDDGMITLLFSGINDDQSYRYTDVVVPHGTLKTEAESSEDAAEAVGGRLKDRFRLERGNRKEGGSSQFDWILVQDTEFDKDGKFRQNLELYIELYYNAVYIDGTGVRGNDNNDGFNCRYPVKTWERAVEIWEEAMLRSLEVRNEKYDGGKGVSEEIIKEQYPLPDTIYICGTVTIGGSESKTWELPVITQTDYDGKTVTTEVMSHSHNSPDPYDSYYHEVPEVLIHVTDTASLTVGDLTIRNTTNLSDKPEFPSSADLYGTEESVTIKADKQASLNITGTALLTGGLGSGDTETTTRGTHVKLLDAAKLNLYSGAIEKRQQGVIARGSKVEVLMTGGEIRENNSYYSSENVDNPLYGAGISVQDGAVFTMEGGTITGNIASPYGGGVYVKENTSSGNTTAFYLNKGSITANGSPSDRSVSRIVTSGTGIYAEKNTLTKIGTSSSGEGDALIDGNWSVGGDGVGIWSDGDLILDHATITGNYWKRPGWTSADPRFGIGIYVGANGYLNMDESWVSGNYTEPGQSYSDRYVLNTLGAGIYFDDNGSTSIDGPRTNTITNSYFIDNVVGVYEKSYASGGITTNAGGAIYAKGKLKIDHCTFTGNETGCGGAVAGASKSEVRISASKMYDNEAYASDRSYGGGAVITAGSMYLLSGTEVIGNRSEGTGGGAYVAYPGMLRLEGDDADKPVKMNNNTAKNSGGGINVASGAVLQGYFAEISGNAGNYGAGGGVNLGGEAYLRSVQVDANKALYGGGLYVSDELYMTDCSITGNTASGGNGQGGGIYLDRGEVYLTEDMEGSFQFTGNTAKTGGGIYVNQGEAWLDIAGEVKNSATDQGSNVYLYRGSMTLAAGAFKQPDNPLPTVYNFYMNNGYRNFGLQMDLGRVTIEKKTSGNAEAVYLDTARTIISALNVPQNNEWGSIPLDLNPEVFINGSTAVKPAGLGSVSMPKVNTDATDNMAFSENYTPLTDISGYADYFSGGQVLRRTQLGGMGVNIVLLAEGVYLSGTGNDETNDGLSPDKPVRTFAKAKDILEKQIMAAYNNPDDTDGFIPFIYICNDPVIIAADETWELNDDTDLFKIYNKDYIDTEMAEEQYTSTDQVPLPQVRRYTAYTSGAMIQVGASVSKPVTFQTDRILIDGVADASIVSSYPVVDIYGGSHAILTGDTRITNSFKTAVKVGRKSTLLLTGAYGQINTQLTANYADSVLVDSDATVTMEGYASIDLHAVRSDITYSRSYGIDVNSTTTTGVKIYMNGHSSIRNGGYNESYGIGAYGNGTVIEMNDYSSISDVNYGIYVAGGVTATMNNEAWIAAERFGIDSNAGSLSTVTMNDKAEIKSSETGVRLTGTIAFQMCDNTRITDVYEGIQAGAKTTHVTVTLSDQALLQGRRITYKEASNAETTYGREYAGVLFGGYASNSVNGIIEFTMEGSARITDFEVGMNIYNCISQLSIHLDGQSAIEHNLKHGIDEVEYSTGYYGGTNFEITMSGSARISGHPGAGIYLVSKKNTADVAKKITLSEHAVIGAAVLNGKGYYSADDASSANQSYGIFANSPVILTMKGSSMISGNGAGGVYLTRIEENSSSYTAGTGMIQMEKYASICDNRAAGIYVPDTHRYYPNPYEIKLDGTAADARPTVVRNENAIYLGQQSTLTLAGTAVLGGGTASADNQALDCYGKLFLDGASTVDGVIYLRIKDHPITMTGKVVAASPQTYNLQMAEVFMGFNVVVPVNPYESGSGIDDVEDQLQYFIKAGADGLAADKILRAKNKCIILQGDNNVYLSGDGFGYDTNDGRTPSTPVRTFRQAKYLLENDDFDPGANIVICNITVDVKDDDQHWAFDAGGLVTNKSGESWVPLIIRYHEFEEELITISGSKMDVTFENVTIDGGSAKGITFTKNGSLIYIEEGGTATLGEGAALQNNKLSRMLSHTGVGVYNDSGTFILDGGTIKNMEMYDDNEGYATAYVIATAIYARNSAYDEYPGGSVIIKSGQIIDNSLDVSRYWNSGTKIGTIVIANQKQLEMSGGVIENNTIIAEDEVGKQVGTIVILQGSASISGGIIRNNTSTKGSAIYYYGSGQNDPYDRKLEISGGQITGNKTNIPGKTAVEAYSPIYIDGNDFRLKGNGADIGDNIYLATANSIIKVNSRFLLTQRIYHVYLNEQGEGEDFRKGHVVVQPDGSIVMDVTAYYANFDVHTAKYIFDYGRTDLPIARGSQVSAVAGVVEKSCLLLMKPVYLDSGNLADPGASEETGGSDSNPGTSPSKAVRTFTKAKETGSKPDGYKGSKTGYEDYYIIYVSGAAVNTTEESAWDLPVTAYMCRYTGFSFYEGDVVTPKQEPAYHGALIEPQGSLAIDGIAIYGRRVIDKLTDNGESLINIKNGAAVTISETVTGTTIFERNNNLGTYIDADGRDAAVNSRGGAFTVEAGGSLKITGGSFQDTDAAYGSAVYLGGDEQGILPAGKLYLTGSPIITGNVYLSGNGNISSSYIETDKSFVPKTALGVAVFNDFHSRPVIQYMDGTIPGLQEQKYFLFSDAIRSSYEIVNNDTTRTILELFQRRIIYLDGVRGSDDYDGNTPETAYETLEKVFKEIGNAPGTKGTLVYIVDTVTVDSGTIALDNYYFEDTAGNTKTYGGSYRFEGADGSEILHTITGEVILKRYARPDGYKADDSTYSGYGRPTMRDTLLLVTDNGRLELNGMYLDGHSLGNYGNDVLIKAEGVIADAPLVTVQNGGQLSCGVGKAEGSKSSPTRIANNINNCNKGEGKTRIIGRLENEDIREGSAAGIEVLASDDYTSQGLCILDMTEFSGLELRGNRNFGGTDVYTNGQLQIKKQTLFGGTVYLEGFGSVLDEATHATSRYIEVMEYGYPVKNNFQILMRDKYDTRIVVYYVGGDETGNGAGGDLGYYLLEERIKDYFRLGERIGKGWILELQIPKAVYIDGSDNGDNALSNPLAGSTPENPVRDLWRAYELLYTRGGNTIYVVNHPIAFTSGDFVEVTGDSYVDKDHQTYLPTTTHVWITRYLQPDYTYYDDKVVDGDEYSTKDYEGLLLDVGSDARVYLSDGVYFDGHRNPKTVIGSGNDSFSAPKEVYVNRYGEAKAPLVRVDKAGVLNMFDGVRLIGNNNTYQEGDTPAADQKWMDGGAIYNLGQVNAVGDVLFSANKAALGGVFYNTGTGAAVSDGAVFDRNEAGTWVNEDNYTVTGGSAVYQDGTFTIKSAPENLAGHTFYLTNQRLGTDDDGKTIWGDENILQIGERLLPNMEKDEDGNITVHPFTFMVDMDHAIRGRDVIRFTDPAAYDYKKDADAEYDHFEIYGSVPRELFLVAALKDKKPDVLELQNWRILDVKVPDNIYLAFVRAGSDGDKFEVKGIGSDAEGSGLFKAPDYQITNNGLIAVEVYISGFEDDRDNDGVNDAEIKEDIKQPIGAPISLLFEPMTLLPSIGTPSADTDLYLAVMAADTKVKNPFKEELNSSEISLDYFAQGYPDGDNRPFPRKLGILAPAAETGPEAESIGTFTFTAKGGTGFISKYADSAFPVTGASVEAAQQWMDGTGGKGVNARAKYILKYKLWVPDRQGEYEDYYPTSG